MTELAKLFAIKLLLKDLRYSDTRLKTILDEIEALIQFEKSTCTQEYSERLQSLNSLIDTEI